MNDNIRNYDLLWGVSFDGGICKIFLRKNLVASLYHSLF